MRILILGFALLLGMATGECVSAQSGQIPLRVLYLAREDAKRTKAFTDFLSERFEHCQVEKRGEFDASKAENFDVVVVDWSQAERNAHEGESPLGPLQNWKTPTVFLGSAGLLMADAWGVIGDAG